MNSKNFQTNPKSLGIHPYFLQNYQLAASNFSLEASIKIIHLLKQTDLKIKGIDKTRIDEKELMLDLVLDIIEV